MDRIIALWPNLSEFAKDVGVSPNTAKQMRRRGLIAPNHWPALVSAARRRNIPGITFESLTWARNEALSERAA